ncbi:MAG: hypothetical protein ACREOF_06850 [Gemmatimonadales bacterium]
MNRPRPPELERILGAMGRRSFRSLAEAQAWLDRRMAEYNAAPQAELGGLSPVQVSELLLGDWQSTGALRLEPGLAGSQLDAARFLQVTRLLLQVARDEGPLPATAAGNLTRRSVSQLVDRIRGADEVRAVLRGPGGVLNEPDIHLLHIPRLVLGLAGLLARRKGFRITSRGRALLDERRTGELFAELFRTYFRTLNLAYLDRGPEQPGFQRTVAFSIVQLGRHAADWTTAERLAGAVFLPGALDPTDAHYGPHTAPWLLATRLLHPLREFGLLERRLRGDGPEWQRVAEFRKVPLFDRFLRFDFGGPGGEAAVLRPA